MKHPMESVFLKIRINLINVKELCNRSVARAYVQERKLEGFLPDAVNFHIYLETYLKPQNVRDLICRKIGNGNANYSMKKVKASTSRISG